VVSRGQTWKKSQLSLFILDNRKRRSFHLKDDNVKIWMEVIIVTFLYVVATVDVLMANSNDVNLTKPRYAHFTWPWDRYSHVWPLVLANFITCLLPEIPRDIAFIPSILERVQRWQVPWIRSIRQQLANCLSEISCLQVRASHYLSVLSPSFIFTWTAITNNAFEICINVSYCCLGDITPKDLSLHGGGGPQISEVTCGGSRFTPIIM